MYNVVSQLVIVQVDNMLKTNNITCTCTVCVCVSLPSSVYMLIFDSVIMIMIIYRGHWTTAS